MNKSELIQKIHYNKIATKYECYYFDKFSQKYREKFINNNMTEGINLSNLDILEAMCGSGQITQHLFLKGARVTGLDISSEMIKTFKKKWPEYGDINASILNSKIKDSSFDCVVVVGGFHHLHPNLDEAVDEIYRILKPGGYFCFMEPHTDSLPDLIRQLWYRFDNLFEKNERAINVDNLKFKNSHRFEFIKTKYLGNIAYLLVMNALVFRIPLFLRPFYAPIAFGL